MKKIEPEFLTQNQNKLNFILGKQSTYHSSNIPVRSQTDTSRLIVTTGENNLVVLLDALTGERLSTASTGDRYYCQKHIKVNRVFCIIVKEVLLLNLQNYFKWQKLTTGVHF